MLWREAAAGETLRPQELKSLEAVASRGSSGVARRSARASAPIQLELNAPHDLASHSSGQIHSIRTGNDASDPGLNVGDPPLIC
jgi:hypothetical protein